MIDWACEQLRALGYTMNNHLPEKLLNTPWSYVIRFETTVGYIYLKHTPEHLGLEAAIIQLLRDQFNASVPIVIAQNTELNCFLMKDAGQSLRTILKQEFNTELLCKAVEQFTALQLATADHTDVFLDIGVPDWRLDKLPNLYKELFLKKDILIEDGLSEIEISELIALFSKVSHLCKTLSDYSIKQTIVQPDFNDNNTLIDDVSHVITTIDLGEIVISHPFFSLLNCLQQIKKHYGITAEDNAYLRIMDTCLENFRNFHSKQHLLDAFRLAELVWPVYGMLAQYRLMMACDKEKIMSFKPGRLSASMKEFIAVRSI
ncbi:MAG: aminoglycoside phosphotransferase family protein [Tatlockia sp.]|nr:aminoglycoside phosphotransferase family protein [Tatlockia sp.]